MSGWGGGSAKTCDIPGGGEIGKDTHPCFVNV